MSDIDGDYELPHLSAYRSAEEVKHWQTEHNPITRLQKWLKHKNLWDDEMEEKTRSQTRKDIIQQLSIAEGEKNPPLKEMFTDVYANITDAQRQDMKRIMLKYPEEYDIDQHEGGIEGI